MSQYTVYNSVTGEILKCIEHIDIPNEPYIEGRYTPATHYIDVATQTPVPMPVRPGSNYKFNYSTKQYEAPSQPAITADQARRNRNLLLSTVDSVNPIWYASLTQDQQLQLQTYRQALLDVPQQAGFPQTVEWPTKPDWL